MPLLVLLTFSKNIPESWPKNESIFTNMFLKDSCEKYYIGVKQKTCTYSLLPLKKIGCNVSKVFLHYVNDD